MKTNLLKVTNVVSLTLIGVVAFLAPLLFTTSLGDVFDLPKQLLLYFVIGLLVVVTAVRYLVDGVKLRSDALTLPLVLLGVAAFLGSYFGLSRLSSLMNGLPPFLALILYYILLIQNLPAVGQVENREQSNGGTVGSEALRSSVYTFSVLKYILYALLASVTFLALWRVFNFFELYLPLTAPIVSNRAFTPVGTGVGLSVLMAMMLPVALAFLLRSTRSSEAASGGPSRLPRYLSIAALALSLLTMGTALILTAPAFAFVVAGFGLLIALIFTPTEALKKMKVLLLGLSLALLLIIVAFHVPFTANKSLLDKVASFPKETQLDLRTSWVVGVHTVRDFPFFGSGLSTYLSDFSRYRPLYYNLSPLWNVRFPAAGNYVLQLLSTFGLVGLGVFTLFTSRLIKLVRREYLSTPSVIPSGVEGSTLSRADDKVLKVGLGVALLTYLVSLLFTVPSFTVNLVFYTLLAVTISLPAQAGYFVTGLKTLTPSLPMEEGAETEGKPAVKRDALPFLIIGPAVLLALAIFYFAGRFAYADYTFRKGINLAVEQKAQESFNTLRSAIQINPYRDSYHLSLGSLAFSLADSLAAKGKEMTKDDQASLLQLLDFSIKEAKNAVTLDPSSPDNWYNLASLYRNVAGVIQNAPDWAVATYQQAIILDPVNPILRMDLGGLFYLAGDYESAANYFREAVSLKQDLANAHFNLAYAYRQKNMIAAAYNEMLQASRLVPLDSADYKRAADDLETLKKLLPAEAQAQLNANAAPTGSTPTDEAVVTPMPTPALNVATPSAVMAQPKVEKILLPEASPSTQPLQ